MTEAQAVILGEHYLDLYGLTAKGWKFGLVRRVRNIGMCYYHKKLITVSVCFIHDDAQVKDTILHEIAHALVGPQVKAHGTEWKQAAMSLGCEPRACGFAQPQAQAKYLLTCLTCGYTYNKYRKPRVTRSCPKCSPTCWNPVYKMTVTKV